MRVRRGWLWIAVAAGLALAGCGDSNVFDGQSDPSGPEAQKEAGIQAINDGSWDEAIEIFGGLYDPAQPDPDVVKYLASAYVGKAGFSTLDLVQEIAEAQEQGGADAESIIYDKVTQLFDKDGDGQITAEEVVGEGGKLDLLETAIGYLIPGYGAAGRAAADATSPGPTDDQRFQAGLYAAVHAVLSIVGRLDYPEGTGPLLLTLDALRANVNDLVIGANDVLNRPSFAAPPTLEADLALVSDARDVLLAGLVDEENQNDIAAEFDEFLTEIGYTGGATPNDVTTDELRAYLLGLLDNAQPEVAVEVPQ